MNAELIQGLNPAAPSCPSCGKLLDGWTGTDGHQPNVGDVSLCLYCGEPMIFDEGLRLRKATDTELVEIVSDTRFQRAARLAKTWRERHQTP